MVPGTAAVDKRARRWHDTSIHEAGHAVIGTLVDIPIREMWLRYTLFGNVKGRTQVVAGGGTILGTTGQDLVFAMGGPEAEAIHLVHSTNKTLAQARRTANRTSHGDVANIADCLRDETLDTTRASALAWVHDSLLEHWDHVENLAEALRVTGRLNAREIACLL
jgi:hypothetical protein